ncbi:3-hydroxyisobutyrate dehydrogenase-like beta-hydroxyacid dehydrogenase [Kibdelosporangium banguiense]|uniref:3-hydroxyisobutyrate dehydrogenase-like beta-hydroxyacid dehydrogenase n=1 Tax=Kibdelosporangium banguiense TaxID=1365924 RepID=A0ABS4TV64_9PSEU|nr:NAD(P)-dependent oxidoreductase [Kibdelosporangium banguiense]MBP2328258.1 3-hydroxyisobutyrate dehydrogenase-like beta-hydroxyacid dehydrogenase [Kibdelosporangium banguiense]
MTVTVAVLGLGEAGGAIARDLLAAGAVVRAYDPAVAAPAGMVPAASEADAVTGAGLTLSVNSAKSSIDALRAGIAACQGVWADLNTASPGTKRQLAEIAADKAVAFADVAIMAPVPGRGLRTPMLASGPAAAQVAEILNPLGASVDTMAGPAGLAAERKLLRSVFFKGLAAAVVEALEAARAAGCEQWLRDNVAEELARADESTVDRLVTGTRQHAVRRADEMSAATDMLAELGVEPAIAAATRDFLTRIANSV